MGAWFTLNDENGMKGELDINIVVICALTGKHTNVCFTTEVWDLRYLKWKST